MNTLLRLTAIVVSALMTTAPLSAALDPGTKKPYQLQIVLHVGPNRVFTPLFQEQLQRDLANQLQHLFSDLARIEVVRAHPLLADVQAKGLDQALERWDALSERTTHFVLLDYADGMYQMQTRFHDGMTGQPGPLTRTQTADRASVAHRIARLIETAFSPVGTVTSVGKDVTLMLQGGELGVPMDRWVKSGQVFAVSRIAKEGGRTRAVNGLSGRCWRCSTCRSPACAAVVTGIAIRRMRCGKPPARWASARCGRRRRKGR